MLVHLINGVDGIGQHWHLLTFLRSNEVMFYFPFSVDDLDIEQVSVPTWDLGSF